PQSPRNAADGECRRQQWHWQRQRSQAMSFSKTDQQLQRYLDGQLSESEAAAFAARMLSDGGLRQQVETMERVRAGFASEAGTAKAGVMRAPAGFTASVMAEVRRLPSREQLQQNDIAE